MRDGQSPRGPSPPLDFGGDGRGLIGRLRFWGVILVVGGGLGLLVGAYLSLQSKVETRTAAAIEDGWRPNAYSHSSDQYEPLRTEVVGHLVQADAVVVAGRRTRIYAPLVSDRPGADEHPRIYFGALERAYDRQIAAQQFRGFLGPLPFTVRRALESHGRAVGEDVYLLQDSGFRIDAGVGRALVLWGAGLGVLGIFLLLFAARRQAASA